MKEQALAKTLITAWHAGSLSSEGSAADPPQQSAKSTRLCWVVGQASTLSDVLFAAKFTDPAASPDIVRKPT
jgi:hypothetical protein